MSLLPVPGNACDGLIAGPRGSVSSVVDGDTVILDTGMVVRLVGIQAPKLALARPGFSDWPFGSAAKSALEGLALGKTVRLAYGGEQADRYGRVLAQMYVAAPQAQPDMAGAEQGLWVQQAMLGAGMARVYSFPDNRKCLDELYAAENRARTNRLGIWADPFYSVRQADRPETLAKLAGHYELVEGRVIKASVAQGQIYLNFGRHWKDDFTAVIEARALRLFKDIGSDPKGLGGALVRVRGWVDERDGPQIAVTHPEQIEVLSRP